MAELAEWTIVFAVCEHASLRTGVALDSRAWQFRSLLGLELYTHGKSFTGTYSLFQGCRTLDVFFACSMRDVQARVRPFQRKARVTTQVEQATWTLTLHPYCARRYEACEVTACD